MSLLLQMVPTLGWWWTSTKYISVKNVFSFFILLWFTCIFFLSCMVFRHKSNSIITNVHFYVSVSGRKQNHPRINNPILSAPSSTLSSFTSFNIYKSFIFHLILNVLSFSACYELLASIIIQRLCFEGNKPFIL